MINLAKIYLDELKYFQTFLYEIQNQGFPNWREDRLLGKKYEVAPPISKVQNFEECLLLNVEPNISLDHLLLITQNYKNHAHEIVLLQFDLVTFTLLKENFVFFKAGVIFVFNFELFQKADFVKKTIASKFFAPSSKEYPNYLEKMCQNVEFIKKNVHLNCLIVPEISSDIDLKRIQIIDLPNTIFIGQKLNFKYAIGIEFPFWLLETASLNTKSWILHRQLDLTNPYTPKTMFFDCLFGKPKKTRMSFYQKMVENQLDKVSLITHHGWPSLPNSISFPKKFEEVIKTQNPNMEFIGHPTLTNRIILKNLDSTVNKISLHNVNLSFSQVLDLDIYQSAAYSVVFETHVTENNDSTLINSYFITEKTCKPMLGKRLFLIYGVPFFLKHLQSLGFKTFHGIIDESYDSETNEERRENLLIQEMKKLSELDQTEIFEKIKPIVQHNYNNLFKLVFDENTTYFLNQFE